MERVHNKLKDSCKRKDLQSVMRKVVVVRRKEEVISRNILWKRSTMQNQKRDFSEIKKLKFLKKKQFKGKTLKVYFVCRKPSHFAKNYSRKEKAAELLEQVQIYVEGTPFSNVESLFSFDNDYSPQALVVMAYFTSKEDSASLSSNALDPEIQTIYTSQPIIASLTDPTPIAQVHIPLETYSRLILVIALFDTGPIATILHPRFYLQKSGCPITKCLVQQMEKHFNYPKK